MEDRSDCPAVSSELDAVESAGWSSGSPCMILVRNAGSLGSIDLCVQVDNPHPGASAGQLVVSGCGFLVNSRGGSDRDLDSAAFASVTLDLSLSGDNKSKIVER